MPDRLFKKLERAGKIRKQKAGFVQIEALLKEAILDLEEAEKIVHIAERARSKVEDIRIWRNPCQHLYS